jgi:predicted enzyme related to lactoylglutathione lyase
MVKLDHLSIEVRDCSESRDWYIANFGFKLEFEVPQSNVVALQDDAGFTLFLAQVDTPHPPSCVLYLQVENVDAKHAELAEKGIAFDKPPQKLFWGYGAELLDPSGYRLGLWDEVSMRERGND